MTGWWSWWRKPGTQCPLQELGQELERNFEKVLVMEQRGIINIRLECGAGHAPELAGYDQAVSRYNQAFDDHAMYQAAYILSPDGQTRDKALILDQKFDVLSARFIELKPAIVRTIEALKNT